MSEAEVHVSDPKRHAAPQVRRVAGTPRQIGRRLGGMTGKRLEQTIDSYIAEGPARFGSVNWAKLAAGAQPWLETLPTRFVDEIEGLAEGSGVPVQRIAEWSFVESCVTYGCSSVLINHQGATWIARNNDLWAPDLWGFATIRDIRCGNRVPTLMFGMDGEPFSATGVNKERLWLHCHFLPTFDRPAAGKPKQDFFVWLTDALETCTRLSDIEHRLAEIQRTAAMLLFAVDGRNGERAVYECDCASHHRLTDPNLWIAGTNHRRGAASAAPGSQSRLEALTRNAAQLHRRRGPIAQDLIQLLADPEVEQRAEFSGTVYSVVACPESGELHFTFGGFPAATQGRWAKLGWPWGTYS